MLVAGKWVLDTTVKFKLLLRGWEEELGVQCFLRCMYDMYVGTTREGFLFFRRKDKRAKLKSWYCLGAANPGTRVDSCLFGQTS